MIPIAAAALRALGATAAKSLGRNATNIIRRINAAEKVGATSSFSNISRTQAKELLKDLALDTVDPARLRDLPQQIDQLSKKVNRSTLEKAFRTETKAKADARRSKTIATRARNESRIAEIEDLMANRKATTKDLDEYIKKTESRIGKRIQNVKNKFGESPATLEWDITQSIYGDNATLDHNEKRAKAYSLRENNQMKTSRAAGALNQHANGVAMFGEEYLTFKPNQRAALWKAVHEFNQSNAGGSPDKVLSVIQIRKDAEARGDSYYEFVDVVDSDGSVIGTEAVIAPSMPQVQKESMVRERQLERILNVPKNPVLESLI